MKIIKQIGFIIIAIGIILGLYQAYLLILNYLYDIFGIIELIGTIRLVVLFAMLTGFFIIIIGGVIENYLSKEKGLEAKIMAGGGPVTLDIAKQYGADGWALTAPLAVQRALELLGKPVVEIRTP